MSATRSDTHTATRKATHLPLMKCQLHPVVGAATLLCHLYANWLVPVAREFAFSTNLDTHTALTYWKPRMLTPCSRLATSLRVICGHSVSRRGSLHRATRLLTDRATMRSDTVGTRQRRGRQL